MPCMLNVVTAVVVTDYIYSDDDDEYEEEELLVEDEEEGEAELLGLKCLPEAMMCSPFSGFLHDGTWDTFWGTAGVTTKTNSSS